jgi:hypothetical protein
MSVKRSFLAAVTVQLIAPAQARLVRVYVKCKRASKSALLLTKRQTINAQSGLRV